MKTKITLYSLFLILFVAASCGGDDDPKPQGAALSGTWAGQQQFELTYTDGQLTDGDTIQLTAPDVFTLVLGQGKFSIHSTIDGEADSESGTYTVHGDALTLADGGDSETYQFVVKGTTLTIEQSETETIDGKTVKEVERIVFKKQ